MGSTTGAGGRRRGRVILRVVLVLFVTLLFFLLAEGAASLFLASRQDPADQGERIQEERHCKADRELGWVNIPDLDAPDLFGPGVGFSTNALGFRGRRTPDAAVAAGRYRIVFLGDSY